MSVWALLVRFNLGDGESFQVPCTLKITGERKFVSILTERKAVTITDFFFIFPQKFELSGGILAQGTTKMVRLSECSSYRGFELSSDFYEKVLAKVQGELQNSSSYWKFELSGVRVIGSILYFHFSHGQSFYNFSMFTYQNLCSTVHKQW